MGNRWRRLLVFLAVMVVLGLVTREWLRVREPVYRGRTLSSWIKRLPAAGSDGPGIGWAPLISGKESAEQLEAEDALRHIGTNALPYLLTEIHTTRLGPVEQVKRSWTMVKEICQRFFSPKPAPGAIFYTGMAERKSSAEIRHWNAGRGLYALGPLAEPVIPDLERILGTNTFGSSGSDDAAAFALGGMGSNGVAALVRVMTNSVPTRGDWPQLCAIWALGQSPTNGAMALPQLIDLLHDKDGTIRMGAAWSLGQIRAQPELTVPALAANLTNSDMSTRSMTEEALKGFGMSGFTRSALTNDLNSPKSYIRAGATNGLRVLFPDEAAKHGILPLSSSQ